jgi:Fe-S oxidoreductase
MTPHAWTGGVPLMTVILLLFLTVVSVGYFARVVARRLGTIAKARPKLPSDQVGRRLWQVFCEVFLQTRVIRERPMAGILHALVMWGFFVFAWVSAEHFLQAFQGLDNAARDESWYGLFAGAWALAVLVGIAGLSFRRFILRPPSLGKVSVSSGLVALLIAGLMITYLVGWRGLDAGSRPWQINWWLHTACFLGMLFAIPNSKHLHLVVGPVAIFFRSGTTSATRALREGDDEDFGMLAFQHLSQKDILDLNACVECGRCTDYCPANVTGGSLDPKKVILQMQQGWLRGGETVAGTLEEVSNGEAWVSEPDLYQCLSCGACEEACPVGIEHVGAKIFDLRRGLVSAGRTHNDKLTDLFNTMERAPHNPLGLSHDVRQKFIEAAGFPVFDGSQQWLFWLGCGNSYDPHGQQVARAMKKLLDAAGVSWGVLQRETCCGEPARRAGNEYLYMEFSEKVIDALQSKHVKQIVTCDPHCARMFDSDYRQNTAYENLGIHVAHHAELLDQLKARLPLKSSRQPLTFHDPCYLARGRGVTEEPRSLLQAMGAQLIEPVLSGKQTFCCGAGGGQLYLADDRAESQRGRVNFKRFEQLTATGAATIAVACPYCPIMLTDAAHAAGREDVRIADVAELLAERL